ncbi:MAG: alanine dehydrogenase [Myxococcales bacterium]|nr:alanine dehydrogenase [Myxococcales bacterium]
MRVGVPRELKDDENRVAITPAGVTALAAQGHEVLVEAGAGLGSNLSDEAFAKAGARVVPELAEVWNADMVLKVKEPLPQEYPLLRRDQVLFTYLHLAASRELTEKLLERGVIALAYETVELEDGTLPLLLPMSEVAGCLAVQAGQRSLEKHCGGKGILMPGVSGVRRGRVTILGAGIAGQNACRVATGLGAEVTILDIDPQRLAYVRDVAQGHVTTLMSNRANVEESARRADLVIGAVLIAGAKAPSLVTREMLRQMEPGSAIVDIAVDQGGCVETTRPTTHHDPRYVEESVVHYAVANMPGAVPQTSTYALTNATLTYALQIAEQGVVQAARHNPALARGINCYQGALTYKAVAEAFDLPHTTLPI